MTAHQFGAAYIPFGELLPEVARVWLQAVLQDACQGKFWIKQSQDVRGMLFIAEFGCIEGDYHSTWKGEGASPAEALLAAYLETRGDE